jgi:addiction module HigA family antidote
LNVIRSFRNKDTCAVFLGKFVKGLDAQIQQRAREKLRYLDSAADLRDLMVPPANQLERLKGTVKASTAFGSINSGVSVLNGKTGTRSMWRSLITTKRHVKELEVMATKKLRPVHPGDILLHDFMQPLKLSSYKLAKELGVTAPTVNEIVRRRRAVTAEMALRFSRYFGTSAQLWQNLQSQYDLEIANRKIGKQVERKIQPLPRPDLSDAPLSS